MPYALSKHYTRSSLPLLYNDFGYKIGAEIGVSRGKHAASICTQSPGIKLYCIDPWVAYKRGDTQEKEDKLYKWTCHHLSRYNVEIIRKTSMEALSDFKDESLDFVYIDGNHKFDYVMPDLIFWSQKVKSGGIVGLHDYCHFYWSGVIKAVDAYTYCHDIRPWFITKEDKPTVFWVKP